MGIFNIQKKLKCSKDSINKINVKYEFCKYQDMEGVLLFANRLCQKSAPKGERSRMTCHAKMGFGEDFPQQAKCLWITRGIACHDCNKYL